MSTATTMEAYRAMTVLDWPSVTRAVETMVENADRLGSTALSLDSHVARSADGNTAAWPILNALDHGKRERLFAQAQRALHASTALSGVLMARSALSDDVAPREVYENVCATLNEHYRELRAANQHVYDLLIRVVALPGPSASAPQETLFRDAALAWGAALHAAVTVRSALDKAEGVYLDYGEYLNAVTNNVRSA